jgi:hypothetical protein
VPFVQGCAVEVDVSGFAGAFTPLTSTSCVWMAAGAFTIVNATITRKGYAFEHLFD